MAMDHRSRYHFFNNTLSTDFCKRVDRYIDGLPLKKGSVGGDTDQVIRDDIRRTYVYLYEFIHAKDGIEREICLELFRICMMVNYNDWNFKMDLNNFTIQLTRYSADEEGTYDWHEDDDLFRKGFYRKISMSCVIKNCDEGGEFMLDGGCESFNQEEGSVIVFPSFSRHKVSPVKRGTRTSIVAWFYGPEWS